MKSRNSSFRIGVTALALLTLSMASVVSHAQQEGGPPPGGPGGPGGQGPGGGRGFGGPGGGRIQPATAPVDVLASELKLTSTQVDKVKAIQTAYRKERDSMMPGRGGQGGPGGDQGNGGPPDREAMQAMMQKMQTMDKTASDKIAAVLTDDQKAALPGVIQMLGALQSAGVPPQAVSVLKLTSAQKQKAVGISKTMQQAMQDQDRQAMQDARTKAHDKIQALLTDDQKTALDKFNKDHPGRQGGFGGPGGPGGGPGGPGGGQGGDGPPPPPDGNGPPPAN